MADRRTSAGDGGFTLLEVLVALGMLTVGLTTLLGALALGAGTRRGAEMRVRASLLADAVLQRVENELLADHPLPAEWKDGRELAIPATDETAADGFLGMAYRVSFTASEERPELVLVEVKVAWRDSGENEGETFVKILPRSVPMARRVAQRKAT